jgi:hypothetical protein
MQSIGVTACYRMVSMQPVVPQEAIATKKAQKGIYFDMRF